MPVDSVMIKFLPKDPLMTGTCNFYCHFGQEINKKNCTCGGRGVAGRAREAGFPVADHLCCQCHHKHTNNEDIYSC